MKGNIQKAMHSVVEHDLGGIDNSMDSVKLLVSLQKRVIVNMDVRRLSLGLMSIIGYVTILFNGGKLLFVVIA